MQAILEFDNISKHYPGGDRAAIDSVSLSIQTGETIAFVGESGSGKTTLLRLATGLEAPDSGTILLEGKPVASAHKWTPPEKRGVGLVFQGGALFPHMTVSQNIAYGLDTAKEKSKVIQNMLQLVGLPKYGNRYPHELSGGERQRVALARALAPEPSIILLDEPFSNLDRCLRCSLRDEIHRILKSVGATSIFVTHETDDATAIGDRIAIFNKGKIDQVGTAKEIFNSPANAYCARLFCIGSQLARNAPRVAQAKA